MKGRRTELSDAIEVLQYRLIHDKECRLAWRANIAMAIYDTERAVKEPLRQWRNRCAEQAIRYICAGHPDDEMTQLSDLL